MENENRTDWTLPRKNLNPKTKQPYKRGGSVAKFENQTSPL